MKNAKMLMEMQHHSKRMQQMHEDVPTVSTPAEYRGKTHFSAEEVKASWVPKVSLCACTIFHPRKHCMDLLMTDTLCRTKSCGLKMARLEMLIQPLTSPAVRTARST